MNMDAINELEFRVIPAEQLTPGSIVHVMLDGIELKDPDDEDRIVSDLKHTFSDYDVKVIFTYGLDICVFTNNADTNTGGSHD